MSIFIVETMISERINIERKVNAMKEFSYVITDEVGIHARPAGLLVKEARNYESKIVLSKDGKSAEATKLMAVMGLGVKCGQTVNVEITGTDEEAAYEGMMAFFKENL